jgi:N-acetylmuramic acid 6-phosphate etherase
MTTAKSKARDFLAISEQFKLGHLVTESFHPLTKGLSQIVQKDIGEALGLLQSVDRQALGLMKNKSSLIWKMAQDIQSTLKAGNKVFMCGCGATGRLSLVLETLYRQQTHDTNQVISFMAGGDFALIKSVESFEDRVEYGERQLLELGFGPHDLLLSPTEGGETPFVIGATNLASKMSSRSPYFLYCNPDDLLMPILRSKEVLDNPRIHKLNLTVGPMAISGSTRMQASTVLMLAIGMGLLYDHQDEQEFMRFYEDFLHRLTLTNYEVMKGLTSLEANLYKDKKFLNYVADSHLGISILTDTTERSPTFSLKAFENRLEPGHQHSLSYLFIQDAEDAGQGWSELLWRNPRALEWEELNGRIGLTKVLGFDISLHGLKSRSKEVSSENFMISFEDGKIQFVCQDERLEFNWGHDQLFNHLMIKMLLNAHSTLIMGLLDRFKGNVMTWVRPSNNKLIDRAARYILHLLKEAGKEASYEDVVEKIFEESQTLNDNEPIVIKVLDRY